MADVLPVEEVVTAPARRRNHQSRTVEQYREAILRAKGMLTIAARMLDVSPQCMYAMVGRHPELQEARDEAREKMTDFAELKLYERMEAGDAWAINLYLKTQGRKRGYVEQVDHGNAGGEPFRIEVVARDYREGLKSFLPPPPEDEST